MPEIKTDATIPEIGELLDTVSDKLPKIINGLIGTLYSAEAGKNMGQAVGSFYKELLGSGIPQDAALDMAKNYMLSLKDISKIVDK
ncbi:hypothetical protein [Proteiniborus sp. MB09-C3]|uniref:hypothetical protein n=1 Tax=Proteiniborus sp. MB09-C3 TaxID=3050072 RepID=UPI0025573DCF|nr:hypothetical protein [Proteiniborus sp. MB09-C3]WIV12863.1 hypothetical protein QO263_03880 [Proteiniborus sp. MB09-C3]